MRVRSWGLPRNRRWTGSARKPEGWQMDMVDAGCILRSVMISPTQLNKERTQTFPQCFGDALRALSASGSMVRFGQDCHGIVHTVLRSDNDE